MKLFSILGIAVAVFFTACGSKSTDEKVTLDVEKAYNLAHSAGDKETVIQTLTQWAAIDSSITNWAWDTLAYYHYFYKVTPGAVRNPETALFYVNKGLAISPSNEFLKDIKAKLVLEKGDDTTAYSMFEEMWNSTQKPTYFWDLTWLEVARGNIPKALQMIDQAMNDSTIMSGTVTMEHIQAQITEEVKAEAAFLFLKYQIEFAKQNIMKGAEYLQKCMEIDPNFYAAKRSIMELQRYSAGR